MIFDKYPYTNFHEMNDDWIIQTMRMMDEKLDGFVAMNSLTYADPIAYDPTVAYAANTVVIYDNTAYVSKQTIPAGMLPTVGGDYWLEIFPFGDLIDAGIEESKTELSERIDTYLALAVSSLPNMVDAWMTEHPEITTTVENGSISFAKLADDLRDVVLSEYAAAEDLAAIESSEFVQGSLNPSDGGELVSDWACRTGCLHFNTGIVLMRAATDLVVRMFEYDATGAYIKSLQNIGISWDAFAVNSEHQYRLRVANEDLSRLSVSDLPLAVAVYQSYTPIYATEDDLYSVDEHMTNFIKPQSSEYIAATFADFDPGYRTYTGVRVTSAGAVTETTSFNTYAFKCPYDGFTFKTNVPYLFVTNTYPAVNVTLPIRDILSNNESDMEAVRTIAHKGDIVVLCIPAIGIVYLTSPYKNVAVIENLALAPAFDTFKQNAIIDDGLSNIGNDLLNVQLAEDKLIASTTGGLSNNVSYDTYYFKVPVSELTVTCTNGFRACISLNDPTEAAQWPNLKQLLYNTASARVDTFTAHLNDWVVISIGKSQGTIDLQTNYANRFSLPGLRLDWRQQNSFYKYVSESNAKRLYVYYKSGNKYVRWELHNVPAAASNSNTWQIGGVYGYDESLVTGVELVGAGEFELAFKEYGAADYCGGNNHGDENTNDFTLMIDGKAVTLENLDSDYHAFNRIDAIEHATINRCDTPAEDILKHQKAWTFENGKVTVRQSLEFLENLLCDFLCCMLPAYRSAFQYGIRQGRVGTENMSTSTFPKVSTSGNEMMYLMYGQNANAKVSAVCESHSPAASLWVNNASTVNKLYYNFFGQITNTQVAQGTVLQWRSEYDIAYN